MYNIVLSSTGPSGFKHTKEFKERLSKERKGEGNPKFGKEKSKEFKYYKNMDRRGSKNQAAKKVKVIDKKLGEERVYKTIKEAYESINGSKAGGGRKGKKGEKALQK